MQAKLNNSIASYTESWIRIILHKTAGKKLLSPHWLYKISHNYSVSQMPSSHYIHSTQCSPQSTQRPTVLAIEHPKLHSACYSHIAVKSRNDMTSITLMRQHCTWWWGELETCKSFSYQQCCPLCFGDWLCSWRHSMGCRSQQALHRRCQFTLHLEGKSRPCPQPLADHRLD